MPFFSKSMWSKSSFFPLDFYRFKHTVETVTQSNQKIALPKPLWIVGVSPFEDEVLEDEGHVVHIGAPHFTARWAMNEERIEQIPNPNYYDEDLNLIIYDVIPLSGENIPAEEWLLEAACAVGYSKGLIASAPTDGIH